MRKDRRCCGRAFWENLADLFVSKSCAVTTAFVWSEVIQGSLVALISWDANHLTERPSPQTAQSVHDAWKGVYFSFITFVLVLITCTLIAVWTEGKMLKDIQKLAVIQIKSLKALEDQQDNDDSKDTDPLLDKKPRKLFESARKRAVKLMCWQVLTNGLIIVPAFSLATACGYLLVLVALSTKTAGLAIGITAIAISSLVTGITLVCALLSIVLVVLVPDTPPPADSSSAKCCLGSKFCRMASTQAKVAMAVSVGISWDALIRATLIKPFDAEWVIFIYALVLTAATPFLYWHFLDAEKPQPNPETGKIKPALALMYSVQIFLGIALSSIVGWAWRDCWKFIRDLIPTNTSLQQVAWNIIFAVVLTAVGSLVVVGLSGWQQNKNDKAAAEEDKQSNAGSSPTISPASESSRSVSELMRRSTARMAEVLIFAMGIDVGWAWTEVCYAVFLTTVALMHPEQHLILVFIALVLYGLVSTLFVAFVAVCVVLLAVWGKGGGDVFITDVLRAVSPDVPTEKLLAEAAELARQTTSSTIDRQSSGVFAPLKASVLGMAAAAGVGVGGGAAV